MAERLQRILARAGIASRRKSEEIIRAGRVTVNGQVAELGSSADAASDAIKVDGKRLQLPARHRYLLLNKPKGYITSLADPQGRPTVMELVPAGWRKGLVPVGRLDFNTEGLLLLTTDGDFAQRIAHPRYGCRKTYAVKVKGHPPRAVLDRLRAGVVIDGKRTEPAVIKALPRRGPRDSVNSWWSMSISEGRTRQIREMFFRVGHSVTRLRRMAIGKLEDSRLPVGEIRNLLPVEIELFAGSEPNGGQRGGKRRRRVTPRGERSGRSGSTGRKRR